MNWTDMQGQSVSGINWMDISKLASRGINWDDYVTLGSRVDTTMTLVTSIDTNIGDVTDVAGTNSLMGIVKSVDNAISAIDTDQLQTLVDQLDDFSFEDITDIKTTLEIVEVAMGSVADLSTEDTMFGKIAELNDMMSTMDETMGEAADTASTESMFGRVAALKEASANIDGTAASILEEVQAIKTSLGAEGASSTVIKGLDDIKGLLDELKKASRTIVEQGEENHKIGQEMVNKLVEATNKSLKEMGFIGQTITKLDDDESKNRNVVSAKLDELKTYLLSIKEATDSMEKKPDGVNYAVVQAWMEMEGGG